MAYSFQTPKPALKKKFNEILYVIRTTTHQSMGGSTFEAHFCRKLNKIWHTVAKTASVKKLSWKTVLCFLHENKKMFPAQLKQNYTLPDDTTTTGTFDRIEYPLQSPVRMQGPVRKPRAKRLS